MSIFSKGIMYYRGPYLTYLHKPGSNYLSQWLIDLIPEPPYYGYIYRFLCLVHKSPSKKACAVEWIKSFVVWINRSRLCQKNLMCSLQIDSLIPALQMIYAFNICLNHWKKMLQKKTLLEATILTAKDEKILIESVISSRLLQGPFWSVFLLIAIFFLLASVALIACAYQFQY